MDRKTSIINILLLCLIILIVVVISLIIFNILRNKEKYENEYKNVFTVRNKKELRANFLLDNPNGDGVEGKSGSDPTGGAVNYSFMFKRYETGPKKGEIIPNENGDITWQNIPEDAELISDYENGIKMELDDKIIDGVVGAPRLISKKLFRGGLFIFDVEHIPVGCTVWPAIWTNGFVGKPDQYHAKKGTKEYKEGIAKLAKTTKFCDNIDETLKPMKTPEPNLSEYLGRPVYVSMWPSGGEIDIVEQTNFSNTNLFSIHAGASCEVGVKRPNHKNNYMINNIEIDPQYSDYNLRNACGATYWPNPNAKSTDEDYGLGPYSGCASKSTMVGEKGGDETVNSQGDYRYNCPLHASTNAGNTQVVGPPSSFGVNFNNNGGGVFVMEWTPKDFVNLWFFSNKSFPRETLMTSGKPLSNNPNPSSWDNAMKTANTDEKEQVLIASYDLNNPNAINSGCDFNYQSIIMNITLGGGWGGSSLPDYCYIKNNNNNTPSRRGISSILAPFFVKENFDTNLTELGLDIVSSLFNNKPTKGSSVVGGDKSKWQQYIETCYDSDRKDADENKGIDPNTKCYDGAFSKKHRGADTKSVFFSEAYFKIRSISVFQKDGDDNVW